MYLHVKTQRCTIATFATRLARAHVSFSHDFAPNQDTSDLISTSTRQSIITITAIDRLNIDRSLNIITV